MRTDVPSTPRLFFALWPDAATRAVLADTTQALCGHGVRPTHSENLHMTLVFLGTVPSALETRLCQAIDAPRAISTSAFDLHLDHVGTWKRTAVHWLGPAVLPPVLSELVFDLRRRCDDAGVQYDRRVYRPHVTFARTAQGMSAAHRVNPISRALVPPVIWHVHDFALLESRSVTGGVSYSVRRQWSLRV